MPDTLISDTNTDPTHHLRAIVARLRNPDGGCPWDLEQTFATIAPHTIEEAYEVADAIERGDRAALADELGDLLLQVVFHSQIATEEGSFDFDDVARVVCDKMIRRHPHIFGDAVVDSSAGHLAVWEGLKAAERQAKGETSVLDGVANTLPAISRALKLQNRAARVGFDWADVRDIFAKVEEELAEVKAELVASSPVQSRVEDEIGDLLFVAVNLARKAGVDPETALKRTNQKFERRFRRIEALLHAKGQTPAESTLEVMESLWQQAKREEKEVVAS